MSETLTPGELTTAGKTAFEGDDFLEAAGSFHAAAEGYRWAGDLLSAAEEDNNHSVALLQAGDAQGALEAVQGTASIFAAEGDLRRQAMALGNQAAAYEALNQLDKAEELYRNSADLLKQLGEDQLHATVMRSISELQLRSGRHLEAVASMQSGLEGIKKPKPIQRVLKKLLQMPYKLINRS